jgi:polysaccharide pyruvyl transferase WcaK-like protein
MLPRDAVVGRGRGLVDRGITLRRHRSPGEDRGGSPSPRIYLVGTSGYPNDGDELIATAWVRYYRRRFPDAEIWLDSPRPGQSAVLLSRAGTSASCTDTLYHACWNTPSEEPTEILDFGETVAREPGRIPREVSGTRVLESADVIHVVGGGYINALWPRHLAVLSAVAGVARRTGARAALTGAGLTQPVPGARERLVDVLGAYATVDVRDEASPSYLAELGDRVTNTGDDVLLDLDAVPRARGWDHTTVLCLQDDLVDADRGEVLAYAARLLRPSSTTSPRRSPPLPYAGSSFRARLDELGRLKAAVADRSSTLPRGGSGSRAREGQAV